MSTPTIAARTLPYSPDGASFVRMRAATGAASTTLPDPPETLLAHFEPDVATYLREGRAHTQTMLSTLEEAGASVRQAKRVLDFGCGSGRMLRWLPEAAPDADLWGVDIDETPLVWAQDHLGARFRFAAISTFPYLPFADDSIDIAYAGSVFTQFSQLADAWLLELARVLRPGGYFYVTIHDKKSVDLILQFGPDHRLHWLKEAVRDFDRTTPFIGMDYAVVSLSRPPHGEIVFYDREHFTSRLGAAGFDVVAVVEEGFYFQPGIVCQKPG
jgi:ubiquinone/menaquinone biosynthesis C-methylase UbiE